MINITIIALKPFKPNKPLLINLIPAHIHTHMHTHTHTLTQLGKTVYISKIDKNL